ncbi:Arm DNA-binding domain-containing protein [Rosenbergiella nectarea]|uniref:Arm DNA-binding domain-containing protein n=1 Tax=Rosenbergiella nectarea TaxID=988801 RepID=UPI0030C7B8C7
MGKEEQDQRLPRGVTIRRHKSGQTIQITFTYRGILCRESLSRLDVNNKTLNYASRLLGEIQNKIALGTFA